MIAARGQPAGLKEWRSESVPVIKVLYCFHQNNEDSKCEVPHTSPPISLWYQDGYWYQQGKPGGEHGTETKTS